MKTIKITEEAHKTLTEIQALIYKETGYKWTYSELITMIKINKDGVQVYGNK